MAPKRKAASTKPADKGAVKKSKPTKAAPTALETVQSALSNVAETVSKAMDVAGELTLDDGSKTPVGIEEALGETVDVPALKKKGKKAQAAALEEGKKVVEQAKPLKGKAAKAAADAEAAAESIIEKKTGVDVRTVKGKASKAAKVAQDKVDETITAAQPEVEKAVKAAKPLKGKAAKAAQQAQSAAETTFEEVKEAAQDPKNRKKAEDFMHTAEEGVMAAVSKVGEVVGGVVKSFGEASGLIADVEGISPKVKKGKKAVEDKAAEVAEPAKKKGKQAVEAVEEGVETATQAGKKAKKAVEETAEEVTETAKVKGAKGKKTAEEATKQAKGKGAKGIQAADETIEVAKSKGGKAKKVTEDTADAVVETAKTGKRKAAAAAETVDSAPSAKKARDTAGAVVEKGKKAGKAAVKAAADAVEEAADSDSESFIHGFSSSDGEADSSDDESDDEDAAVQEAGRRVDMSKVPMIAKDDKSVQARLKKAQKKKDSEKGTLYLGRIPHGFYEEEMQEYFGQFGDVTQLRLARNRKTGASRHYAYIEMSSQSVAQIVAETMNNYLLMGHLLKCQLIPQDQVHPKLWEGANKKFRKLPRARLEKEKQERPRTEEQKAASNKRVKDKDSKRRQKIKDAGIDYDFEGHQ